MTFNSERSLGECVELALELGAIPAPSGDEGERALRVAEWWRARGLGSVRIDSVGNVWCRVGAGKDSGVVVAAHLDTVFGVDEPHEFIRDGDVITGPGIGDNTVAVAATTVIAAAHQLGGLSAAYWLVATVGEEGLGNLAGMRHVFAEYGDDISTVLAVEGHLLGRVGVSGVGSTRYLARFGAPGGHSWEHRERPSAVHQAVLFGARLLTDWEKLPGCSLNLGTIDGGEGITRRAAMCSLQIDIRSVDPVMLEAAEAALTTAVTALATAETPITVEVLGTRPAGGISSDHPLARAAIDAHRRHAVDARMVEASTDANVAYAAGVPAISLGITTGGDEHTNYEWIRVPEIETGMHILADVIGHAIESAPR